MVNKTINKKNINNLSITSLIIIILVISLNLISMQELEGENFDNLFEKGFTFDNIKEFDLDSRHFKSNGNDAFIQIDKKYVKTKEINLFLMRNVKVTTKVKNTNTNDLYISTPKNKQYAIAFTDVDLKSYDNYMTIIGDSNTKTVNINGKKFSIKSTPGENPPRFVLEDDGELVEAEFEAFELTTYQIKNLKFQVPKNGKVSYKNNLISITVPQGSEISEDPIVDSNKNSEIKLEYLLKKDPNNPENSITISGLKFKGALDKNSNVLDLTVGYDPEKSIGNEKGLWYTKNAKIEDIEIGSKDKVPEKLQNIYITKKIIDSDFNQDSFGNALVSINIENKKLELLVPKGHFGIYATLPPGNNIINVENDQFLAIKALGAEFANPWNDKNQRSRVSIEHVPSGEDNKQNFKGLVISKGHFEIISGKKKIKQNPRIVSPHIERKDIKGLPDEVEKSVPLKILPQDIEGDPITNKAGITFNKGLFINEEGDFDIVGSDRTKVQSLLSAAKGTIKALSEKSEDEQRKFLRGFTVNELISKPKDEIYDILGDVKLNDIINVQDPNTGPTKKATEGGGSTGTTTTFYNFNTELSNLRLIRNHETGMFKKLGDDYNKNKHKSIILKFSATWCDPCISSQPKFAKNSDANPNIKFITIDADYQGRIIRGQFGVSEYPTYVAYDSNGKKRVFNLNQFEAAINYVGGKYTP